jgi:membrane associated rhomboid family serine protease
MVCMGHLYRYRRRDLDPRLPILSIVIIATTALITGLQFVFPEILSMFRRDVTGLRAGEWWRVVTPLFVQPSGVFQCVFNGMFMLAFLPLAEKLYGKRLLALYFIPGVLGQAVNYAWLPDGGGSSTAIFGVMGGLLVYVCRQRKRLPPQYFPIAVAGLCAAGLLSFLRDGHGPALLLGALVATMLRARPLSDPNALPDPRLKPAEQA